MAVMPLVALTDLPFVFAFSPSRWLEQVRCLQLFQQHVTQHQWASLAEVYPRSLIWMYAYLLFTWGHYCHCLPEILQQPDRCLPAEMFIRYVCEIDRYVDSFDSRALWRVQATQFKARPQVRSVATELCAGVQHAGLDAPACRGLINLILTYRREALTTMQHSADASADNLAQVIHDKEQTAGNLWCVWSRILSCLYGISADITERAAQAFFNFGMAVQIIDDLSDAPADHAVRAENLFLAVARTCPLDWERLQRHFAEQPALFLDWPWARRHTPTTYQATFDLYHCYFDRLHCDTNNVTAAQRLCVMLDRMRTLGG
jgi:hypothetical protein